MKKISNEAFQGLWIEISFVNHKNIICGIIYGQHNSPNYFLTYLGKTVEILVSDDKNFYIMGDFNIDLLECKSSKISQEFFNLSSKLLSYSNRTNRSAFIELLVRWLTTSSLTILADFSAGRFHYELSEIDWNRIIANGTNSVNKLFSSFYNKYNTIVDKHAPMKKLSNRKAKQLSKPWITNGIRAATKFKNKLYATGDKVR